MCKISQTSVDNKNSGKCASTILLLRSLSKCSIKMRRKKTTTENETAHSSHHQTDWNRSAHTHTHSYIRCVSPLKWAKTMRTHTHTHTFSSDPTKFTWSVRYFFICCAVGVIFFLAFLHSIDTMMIFSPSLVIVFQSFDCNVQNRMCVCESLDFVRLCFWVLVFFFSCLILCAYVYSKLINLLKNNYWYQCRYDRDRKRNFKNQKEPNQPRKKKLLQTFVTKRKPLMNFSAREKMLCIVDFFSQYFLHKFF